MAQPILSATQAENFYLVLYENKNNSKMVYQFSQHRQTYIFKPYPRKIGIRNFQAQNEICLLDSNFKKYKIDGAGKRSTG